MWKRKQSVLEIFLKIVILAVVLLLFGELQTNKTVRAVSVLPKHERESRSVCDMDAVYEVWQEVLVEKKKEDRNAEIEQIESSVLPKTVSLDVPEVFQNPELPTGCESVALTIMLMSDGYSLDKTTIADDYLIYSKKGTFEDGYIGNPYSTEGAGCFPPVLVKTADKFLKAQGAKERGKDLSGKEFDVLLHYVAAGRPVAVWSTMYLSNPDIHLQYSAEADGYVWYELEHCVVLSGYDLDKGTVLVSDPLEGIVERDLERFCYVYESTGKYAMVIL